MDEYKMSPEDRARWAVYSAKAHQKGKENPKLCANNCGRMAAPRRKLCFACKTKIYRLTHDTSSYSAVYRSKSKMETVKAYGGQCSCCGEQELTFLTLDHIDGGGKQHRLEIFGQKGGNMWAWARMNGFPATLQLLCWNCNSGRQLNGGVCPHQKERH